MLDMTIDYKALPRWIKPAMAARDVATFNGQLRVGEFARLADLLVNPVDDLVDVTLNCGFDAQGRQVINCQVTGVVHMICQRCMQPCPVVLDTQTALSPVVDDEAALGLPGDYEPVVLVGDQIDVREMVEDEILLSLPIAALHEDHCQK